MTPCRILVPALIFAGCLAGSADDSWTGISTTGTTGSGGSPGVQVSSGGGLTCVALCQAVTNPVANPQGNDFGSENATSCIIPGTATATNDPCTTGAALPPPSQRPGFVVRNAAGQRACTAKCAFYTSPTQVGANSDKLGDDLAYENNATCIIPGTVTAATSLACTTGQPLPDDPPRPGVIVHSLQPGKLECVSVCTYFTSPTQVGANSHKLGADLAYEFGNACVIPGTVTAHNQSCTTQQPLPTIEPRPGIMVHYDKVIDSCKTSMCVPLCQVVKAPTNPAYPDWAWENNSSCVIPGTPTATVVPQTMVNPGPAVPPSQCMWAPNFKAPPALVASRNVHGHFQTVGAQLRDPYDQPFVIRGVNNSHGWYDICGQYAAYGALDNIAAQGANSVRVGWAFELIDPVGPLLGAPQKAVIGTTPQLLAEILYRIVELKMIPVLAVNDSTGQTDTDWPLRMARILAGPGYKDVLLAYEPYLLVGIANEWNGTDFYNAYNMAVQYLRKNGINHTLVVTANDWGQGCDSILRDGARLISADPLHNILFDLHVYNNLTYNGEHGGSAAMVQGCMDRVAATRLPLLVGEFGHVHGGVPVQWQTVVARANANNQGMMPWLWYGDTEYPVLNMAMSWEGPLTIWGGSTLPIGPMGGRRATIFP